MTKPFFTHLKALAPRTRKVAAASLWEARCLTYGSPVDRCSLYVIAAAIARIEAQRCHGEANRFGEMHARTAAWVLTNHHKTDDDHAGDRQAAKDPAGIKKAIQLP